MNIEVYKTAEKTSCRLSQVSLESYDSVPAGNRSQIHVSESRTYQEILGFGGAFTESAAHVYGALSLKRREDLIKAYFDREKGNGYNLGRLAIHSCDFSSGGYCYTDKEDRGLESFSIERDEKEIIPFISDAQDRAGEIIFVASPWSPPPWMKTNSLMCNGGSLRKDSREQWALYIAKFIKEYGRKGIPVWGITVQNEAEATQSWESCVYTAEEEAEFVREYLGPLLRNTGLGDTKIIIHDHNRNHVLDRCRTIYGDRDASQYIWGAGIHWYEGDNYQNLSGLHELYPGKSILFTEGCQEQGTHHNSWKLGERYGRSIINDMNNWVRGWLDWNLLLDFTGGPNHVQNVCSAPVLAIPEEDRLFFESSYYYMGHFSRFIKPGAYRILSVSSEESLLTTAFLNPDNSVIVIAMNPNDEEHGIDVRSDNSAFSDKLEGHSIKTYILK